MAKSAPVASDLRTASAADEKVATVQRWSRKWSEMISRNGKSSSTRMMRKGGRGGEG